MALLYKSILKYSNSDNIALYYENKKYSFKDLLVNIKKMITYLKSKGIKKGDVVTIVLPNVPVTIYLFYALNALGAIINIIHPLTPFNGIVESMEKTNSKHVVLLQTLYKDNIDSINKTKYNFYFVNPMFDKSFIYRKAVELKYGKIIETANINNIENFRKGNQSEYICDHIDNADSIYLHSGGTSGEPKTIVLSDEAINNLAEKVFKVINYSPIGKAMLAVLPTFHGFGLAVGIHTPLYVHGGCALMMKFNSKQVIKWINQNKVNFIIGIPLLYQKLMENKAFCNAKLENLDYCFVGGDNVPVSLIESFNNLMKQHNSKAMLLEGYGLTETVTVCNVNTKKDFKLKSVGKPLDGIKILIKDENGADVKENEVGEVYISGNTIMNKYLNDEKTTNETLLTFENKIYVKTGDLGYLDEEGYLFLKGRKKRVFKISGINVYPNEIEKIVSDNLDIFDVSLECFNKDKTYLVLYVIKNKSSNKDEALIKKEIMDDLKDKVLKYCLPSKIVFVDGFPKTKLGKIDHSKFKD